MAKLSAGLLMFRFHGQELEIFLVHPGGPYWAHKDDGAWSIPKGEFAEGENPFDAALREFHEETGLTAQGDFRPLQELRQPSGKRIVAWAYAGDADPGDIRSNTFKIEWPPRSGELAEFPEVDRAAWFGVPEARRKLLKGQVGFVEELCRLLDCGSVLDSEGAVDQDEPSDTEQTQETLF